MNSENVLVAILAIVVVIAIIMAFYVGSRNPRCLLSADPILCLEVHESG